MKTFYLKDHKESKNSELINILKNEKINYFFTSVTLILFVSNKFFLQTRLTNYFRFFKTMDQQNEMQKWG